MSRSHDSYKRRIKVLQKTIEQLMETRQVVLTLKDGILDIKHLDDNVLVVTYDYDDDLKLSKDIYGVPCRIDYWSTKPLT